MINLTKKSAFIFRQAPSSYVVYDKETSESHSPLLVVYDKETSKSYSLVFKIHPVVLRDFLGDVRDEWDVEVTKTTLLWVAGVS